MNERLSLETDFRHRQIISNPKAISAKLNELIKGSNKWQKRTVGIIELDVRIRIRDALAQTGTRGYLYEMGRNNS